MNITRADSLPREDSQLPQPANEDRFISDIVDLFMRFLTQEDKRSAREVSRQWKRSACTETPLQHLSQHILFQWVDRRAPGHLGVPPSTVCQKTLTELPVNLGNFVSFSPDSSSLNGTQIVLTSTTNNTVQFWDAFSGELLKTLTGHTGMIDSVSFSPNGTRIVSASWDNTVRLWHAQSGELLMTLTRHTGPVRSASFSPDGTQIVSASWDSTVRLWDAQNGMPLQRLMKDKSPVRFASFSPDGAQIVSVSEDNTIRLWNAQSRELLKTLTGYARPIDSVVFSPDGAQIVSALEDQTIRLWDAQSGELLKTLTEHNMGPVRFASFSSDGTQILSTSEDNIVRVWDAQSGALLKTLTEYKTSQINSISFSPDGTQILSTSCDGTVRIYALSASPAQRLAAFLEHKDKSVLHPFLQDQSEQEVMNYTVNFIARQTLEMLGMLDRVAQRELFTVYLKGQFERIRKLSQDVSERIFDILKQSDILELPADSKAQKSLFPLYWDPERRAQFQEQLQDYRRKQRSKVN